MKKTLLLTLLLSALLVLSGCSVTPESGKTDNPVTPEQPVPPPGRSGYSDRSGNSC